MVGLLAIIIPALVGIARRSVGATLLSLMLAGCIGTVVVYGAVTHELHDTDDSRDIHEMGWMFVRWWAFSLCAPLGAVFVVFFGPREATKPTSDESAPKP